FDAAIAEAKKEIQQIIDNPEKPTFENTIEAMAFSGMQLDRISNIFFNLNAAETNEELQKIAQVVAPKLSAFGNDITLNPELFVRVNQVHDTIEVNRLTTEQQTLVAKSYTSIARNCALLNDADKAKLRQLDSQRSVFSLQFK